MYKITVSKPHNISDENFNSAIDCLRTSIESVLDNEMLCIIVNDNVIIIDSDNKQVISNLKLPELKKRIKGCFSNADGLMYPEFGEIIFE